MPEVTFRRLLPSAAILAFLVFGVLGFALLESAARSGGPGGAAPAPPCSPQPCADAQGYRVQVSSLEVGAGLVRLQVSFTVRGRDRMHAEPMDFALVSADGRHVDPSFDTAGCDRWPRTQIPDGGGLGPRTLCFRPASTAAPLRLLWQPDEGLVCCSEGIDLTG